MQKGDSVLQKTLRNGKQLPDGAILRWEAAAANPQVALYGETGSSFSTS